MDLSGADDGVVGSRCFLRAVKIASQSGPQNVVDQSRFPASGDAGHTDESAEGKVRVDILEVVLAGAGHAQPSICHPGDQCARSEWLVSFGRNADAQLSAEVTTGQRLRRGSDLVECALGDDLSAERTRAGTDVDDVVGRRNGVVIVLDDEHRVAEVAQAFERGNEALVVALVQPDTRLVQNVEHAGQSAADLRGEADSLSFASGEGSALAFQGKVSQADFLEESEAPGNFRNHLRGNSLVFFAQLQVSHDLCRARDGEVT